MFEIRVALIAVLFCLPSSASLEKIAESQATSQPGEANPVLTQRPPPKAPRPGTLVTAAGKVKLDVAVTDAAGKPVAGLQPWDFKLLDNGEPRRILSFRAFNDSTVKP